MVTYRRRSGKLWKWLRKAGGDDLPDGKTVVEFRRVLFRSRASNAVIVCLSCTSVTKDGYLQKEIRQALEMAAESRRGRSSRWEDRRGVQTCALPISCQQCGDRMPIVHLGDQGWLPTEGDQASSGNGCGKPEGTIFQMGRPSWSSDVCSSDLVPAMR